MKKQQLSQKQYSQIKTAYGVSLFFFICSIIITAILLIGLLLVPKAVDPANILYAICFCFLSYSLAIGKQARSRLIPIAYFIFSAVAFVSVLGGIPSLPVFILSLASSISLLLLSVLLLLKAANKPFKPVWSSILFVVFIVLNIIGVIFSSVNVYVNAGQTVAAYVLATVMGSFLVYLSIVFMAYIPLKAIKDEGFYKYFIETHPKTLQKNKKYTYSL